MNRRQRKKRAKRDGTTFTERERGDNCIMQGFWVTTFYPSGNKMWVRIFENNKENDNGKTTERLVTASLHGNR